MIIAVAALSSLALYLFWQFLTGWVVSYGAPLAVNGVALATTSVILAGFSPMALASGVWIFGVVLLPIILLSANR